MADVPGKEEALPATTAEEPAVVEASPTTTKLLREEDVWLPHIGGIATVTFLSNGVTAAELIKDKLLQVAKANPWICGHLAEAKPTGFNLVSPIDAQAIVIDRCYNTADDDTINSRTEFTQLVQKLQPYRLKNGRLCVGKREETLFQVTVFNIKKDSESAILVEMSHSIADGQTYYQIFNMLSVDIPVKQLTVERKLDLGMMGETYKDIVGEKEALFPFSATYMCKVMCMMIGLFGGGGCKPRLYAVDKEKIKRIKHDFSREKAATEDVSISQKKSHTSTSVNYLTTNDIMVSAFANAVQPTLLEMIINFRGKLPGLTVEDAGVYEGSVFFSASQDYETPEAIRATMNGIYETPRNIKRLSFDRKSGELPNCAGLMKDTFALASNWASFARDLNWGTGVTQILHVPIESFFWPAVIFFKPIPGEIAALVFSRRPLHFDGPINPFYEDELFPEMFA